MGAICTGGCKKESRTLKTFGKAGSFSLNPWRGNITCQNMYQSQQRRHTMCNSKFCTRRFKTNKNHSDANFMLSHLHSRIYTPGVFAFCKLLVGFKVGQWCGQSGRKRHDAKAAIHQSLLVNLWEYPPHRLHEPWVPANVDTSTPFLGYGLQWGQPTLLNVTFRFWRKEICT